MMFQDPTFWVAVAFFLFLVALILLKVPGMLGHRLDMRAEQIQQEIREAENLREEAQQLLATYQRKQREAEGEINRIIAVAREESEWIHRQGAERLAHSLERREKMATDRIAQAEAQAIAEIRQIAVDTAMRATRRVMSEQVSVTRADTLIDDSIREVDRKLH